MKPRIFVAALAIVTTTAADPFNTVTAYSLDAGGGYFGPNVPFYLPLNDGEESGLDPTLWIGYGITSQFNMTLALNASFYSSELNLGDAMIEGRYTIISEDDLAVSPLFDIFVPMYAGGTLTLGPGITVSVPISFLNLHTNLFYTTDFLGSAGSIAFLASPEVWLGEIFSFYAEANFYYSFDDKTAELEFWPGLSVSPVDWLSVNAACGVPPSLNYLSPGLAAYVSF